MKTLAKYILLTVTLAMLCACADVSDEETVVQQTDAPVAETSQTDIAVTEHLHSFGEWITVTEATCASNGEKLRKCSTCDLSETAVIEKNGAHIEATLPAVAPTCTADGLTEGISCTVCGEILVKQEVVKAGHIELVQAAIAPTCTTDGLTEGILCAVCDSVIVKQETVKGGHTEVICAALAPTCVTDGYTAYSKCSVCGCVLTESVRVERVGHFYSAYRENGELKGFRCGRCGDKYVTNTSKTFEVLLVSGALKGAEEVESATHLRSGYISGNDVRICFPDSVSAEIYFYSDVAFISSVSVNKAPIANVKEYMPAEATSFRVVFSISEADSLSVNSFARNIAFESFGQLAYSVKDVPSNEGVYNALRRFDQMKNVTYTLLKNIPHSRGEWEGGKTYVSLPYSSSRPEGLFVPNAVSFYTFLTALTDPDSYIYTVNLGGHPYNNVNGRTYYGAVCSTAVGYALGLTPMYSTHQWTQIPGMEIIDYTDLRNIRLGDSMLTPGHVVMITEISRNPRGEVVSVIISEAGGLNINTRELTPEGFYGTYPLETSVCCRYSKISEVSYTELQYLNAVDESGYIDELTLPLVPRKGDESNWLYGVTVEIDILSGEPYDYVELYKDGEKYKTIFMSGKCVVLQRLEPGSYSACLVQGENRSRSCKFAVVDANSTAQALGRDASVRVEFSSVNAEPLWVQWTSTVNGTVHIYELTEEDKKNGYAVCSYIPGEYRVRVAFKAEYGIVHSELDELLSVN